MLVTSVSLHNTRSYELVSYDLDTKTTLILGKNGSGKTSLIEAAYFLFRGTSFRGRDKDMVAHGSRSAECKITFNDGSERRARIRLNETDSAAKEFIVDQKTTARLPAAKRLPVVLFEPDELRLLTSSPQRRRDFIDGVIGRLSPEYQTLLNRYGRTLLQRNELLKQRDRLATATWEQHLFAWDVKFSELALEITKRRREFIATSNKRLSGFYNSMAGASHEIRVAYSDDTDLSTYQQRTLHKLETHRMFDAERGYTSTGPHRDDITLFLGNFPAAETASRGEMRTIMLAYKLLEVALQEELHNSKPLILMDDVFSELDTSREQALIQTLSSYQTIITATDLRDSIKAKATLINL